MKQVVVLSLIVASCSPASQIPSETTGFIRRTTIDEPASFSIAADVGNLSDISDQELTAACQTLDDAATDLITSDDLQIVTDEGLLRSAELLDGEFADDGVAQDVEDMVTNGVRQWSVIEQRLSEIGTSDPALARAKEYLDARSLQASPRADEFYVVYVVKKFLRQLEVVRRSVYPIPVVETGEGRVMELQRADGSTVGIEASWCGNHGRADRTS